MTSFSILEKILLVDKIIGLGLSDDDTSIIFFNRNIILTYPLQRMAPFSESKKIFYTIIVPSLPYTTGCNVSRLHIIWLKICQNGAFKNISLTKRQLPIKIYSEITKNSLELRPPKMYFKCMFEKYPHNFKFEFCTKTLQISDSYKKNKNKMSVFENKHV